VVDPVHDRMPVVWTPAITGGGSIRGSISRRNCRPAAALSGRADGRAPGRPPRQRPAARRAAVHRAAGVAPALGPALLSSPWRLPMHEPPPDGARSSPSRCWSRGAWRAWPGPWAGPSASRPGRLCAGTRGTPRGGSRRPCRCCRSCCCRRGRPGRPWPASGGSSTRSSGRGSPRARGRTWRRSRWRRAWARSCCSGA
jgi:hypothetical protein